MAHTKAAGSAKRTVDVAGKRLGIKKFSGEYVKPGNIIVRQHGSHFHAGVGTMFGRDYTIFAVQEGFVSFRNMTGHKRAKKLVDVLSTRESVAPNAKKSVAVKAVKSETKVIEAETIPAKKKSAKPAGTPSAKATAKPAKAAKKPAVKKATAKK